MKRRILSLIFILLLISPLAISLSPPHHASAQGAPIQLTPDQVLKGVFVYINAGTIQGTFQTSSGTQSINFICNDVIKNGGCTGGSYPVQGYCSGSLSVGNNLPNPDRIDLHINTPGSVSNCTTEVKGNISVSNPNGADNIFYIISADGQTITSIDGSLTFTKVGSTNAYTNNAQTSSCVDGILTQPDLSNPGKLLMSLWKLGTNKNPNPAPAPLNTLEPNCYVQDLNKTYDGVVIGGSNPLGTAPNVTPGPGGSGGSGATTTHIDCKWSINPLTWFLCPALDLIQGIMNQVGQWIFDFLKTPNSYFQTGPGNVTANDLHQAWSNLRSIALAVLAIMALLMVLSQAFSFGPFDAYTVKKVLPRMIVAAILITLSWSLVGFMVAISNALGDAIRYIIYVPFRGLPDPTLSGGTLSGAAGGLAILGTGLGILGVLSFGAGAALALLTGFLVIIIRQILVLFLAILAPVAIVCYILPGTSKAWDFWWDSFSGVLLMFPIITGFIAIGSAFAKIAASSTLTNGTVNQVVAFVATYAPYFLLPVAIRLAGGAISTLGGAVHNRAGGVHGLLKGFRKHEFGNKLADIKGGNRFHGGTSTNFRGRLNRGMKGATLLPQAGLDPRRMRSRMRTAMNDTSDAAVEELMKRPSFTSWSGDDAKVWASKFESHDDIARELVNRDAGRFGGVQNTARREDAITQIMRSQREAGSATFHKARVRAQSKTGTGYQYTDANGQTQFDATRMIDDINSAYGNDRNGAGKALAEMKTSLAQSGQVAGLAGYGTWAQQMDNVFYGRHTQAEREAAHNAIMDDAINSVTPGQAIYGKPASAAAIGAAHARRIQAIAAGVHAGTSTMDDLSTAVAGAAGLWDAMGSASPGNASALANEMMSASFEPITISQTGPDGQTVSIQADHIHDLIRSQMGGNEEFAHRRNDIRRSSLEEAQYFQQQQQRLNQPGLGGPQQPPLNPPTPPVGMGG